MNSLRAERRFFYEALYRVEPMGNPFGCIYLRRVYRIGDNFNGNFINMNQKRTEIPFFFLLTLQYDNVNINLKIYYINEVAL